MTVRAQTKCFGQVFVLSAGPSAGAACDLWTVVRVFELVNHKRKAWDEKKNRTEKEDQIPSCMLSSSCSVSLRSPALESNEDGDEEWWAKSKHGCKTTVTLLYCWVDLHLIHDLDTQHVCVSVSDTLDVYDAENTGSVMRRNKKISLSNGLNAFRLKATVPDV